MLELYLIRHAKSSWVTSNQTDYERPLNNRGQKGLVVMRNLLKENGVIPGYVWYSSALRTTQTMEGLTSYLTPDQTIFKGKRELYHASDQLIIDTLCTTPASTSIAFYIGHNPGITYALEALCSSGIDNMPTLGIAHIKFQLDSWDALYPGTGELVDFHYPKKYDHKL